MNCGLEVEKGMEFCPRCGMYIGDWSEGAIEKKDRNEHSNTNFSMKWYKFLVYFAIIAGAILNVIDGVVYLLGGHYDGLGNRVYERFPELRSVDIFFGIIYFGVAVFGIVTWLNMREKTKRAPAMLYWLYAISGSMALLYNWMVVAVTNVDLSEDYSVTVLGSICASIIMIVINYVYFNKRKNVFVN